MKKILITIISILVTTISYSQEYNVFMNQIFDLYNKGKVKDAIIAAEGGIDTYAKRYGTSSKEYVSLIFNIGLFKMEDNDFEASEKYLLNTKELYKNTFGEKDTGNQLIIWKLYDLYRKTGSYNKAEPMLIQNISDCKKLYGEKSKFYATSLNDLGLLYEEVGEYTKAENLYIQSTSIKTEKGYFNLSYATTLNNLANLYETIGNYSKAEKLYFQVLDIRKNILGQNHLDYIETLNALGALYESMGNYKKSENYCTQALSILSSIGQEKTEEYASVLNNLAILYSNFENYNKAEEFFKKAQTIIKLTLGERSQIYLTSLDNLGAIYLDNGKLEEGEVLLNKALLIRREIFGEDHPEYAVSLINLSHLFYKQKQFQKAILYNLKALNILKASFGDAHPLIATTISNLAVLYEKVKEFKQAEMFYIAAISLYKKTLGAENPKYITDLFGLCEFYLNQGNYKSADSVCHLGLVSENKYLNTVFSFINSSDALKYIDDNIYKYELSLSSLNIYSTVNLKRSAANFNLQIKNVVLNNQKLLDAVVSKNKDQIVIQAWQRFKEIRIQIGHLLQLSHDKQNGITELKYISDSIEKELIKKLPDFQEIISNDTLTWENVQKKLNSNDASIDFVNFQYYNKSWTDTVQYAAFITRPGWTEPQFVKLFNEEQLAELLDSSNNSLSINNLYRTKDSSYNSKLYNLIWQPIDSLLKGVKRIYISPSGLLNRVSFSAIPTLGGGRLIDRYSVEVMSNIRTIAETKSNVSEKPQSISLIGGVNYDEEPTVSDSQQVDSLTSDTSFSNLRSLKGGKWSYLLGAENEVITINKALTPIKISLSLKIGSNASEEFVKDIGSGIKPVPSVMHIATHGFSFASPKSEVRHEKSFLQNDNKQVFRSSEDALTRAGLVMAGGNKFWTTGTTYQNHEDGILTAREISELNLNGCILATLSACETGLGEIKGSEGVFGLQRAFKMAGVKYLIVSLWKVPDAQTTEFMQLFYSSWLIQKLSIRDAFHQTQLAMSKKYLPYQWAAFVLVE